MKILFFIDGFRSGGKERRCIELLKGLKDIHEFEIHIVSLRKEIVYEEFYNLDYPYYLIEKGRKLDPTIFIKFYKIFKIIKPDIVHCWSSMNSTFSLVVKLLSKFKLINSQITDAPKKINWFSQFGIQTKLNFLFSDIIISNSFAGLESYNAPKNRSRCIHNGFDFKRISNLTSPQEIRNRFSLNTKYIVGMVASFSDNKDYTTYIKAAISILKIRKDVTFLCIGSGNYKPFKDIIPADIKQNIKLLGRQVNVESIMNVCDIGVLSTYTEGISNSIMEYMALGKPVIATDGGGTSELIINNETGYLVSSKSPGELADKIIQLQNNDGLRCSMGQKGRSIIEKLFNITKMIDSFIDVYNQAVRR